MLDQQSRALASVSDLCSFLCVVAWGPSPSVDTYVWTFRRSGGGFTLWFRQDRRSWAKVLLRPSSAHSMLLCLSLTACFAHEMRSVLRPWVSSQSLCSHRSRKCDAYSVWNQTASTAFCPVFYAIPVSNLFRVFLKVPAPGSAITFQRTKSQPDSLMYRSLTAAQEQWE